MTAEEEFRAWRRVDPRTLLMYVLPFVLVGSWYALTATASERPGDRIGAVLEVLVYPLAGVAAVSVRYLTGRYAIHDGAVRWKVGLLVHKATDIGLDRIQDVEVTRPLLARMVGLAAVNVSSAGGAGEIKLQYLDHRVAERLGAHLQHLIRVERSAAAGQGYSTTPTGDELTPTAPLPAVELHRVTTSELATWAAYRSWPVLLVAIVLAVTIDAWVILTLLPTLPVMAIALVRPVFDRANLTVSIDGTSLTTREGLTTVRRTSTQRERVQLVFAHQLFLQRLRGSETVRYASADVTLDRKEGSVREELALNVPVDSWGAMAATVAHRQVIGPEWLRPKPEALATVTRWRWTLLGLLFGVWASLVAIGLALIPPIDASLGLTLVWISSCLVVGTVAGTAFGAVRGRSRRSVEGWAVTPDDLLLRHGVLRRTTLLLFAEKTQAVDVVSGPLQRRLGLVTVVVDVAPPGRASSVVIRDVAVADAEVLLRSLTASGSVPLPNGV